MAYLNRIEIIGNVGKSPEIRTFGSGSKKASFSVATSRKYRDNNGEQKEVTTWHMVACFGKLAETIERLNIAKGTSVYVAGELTSRTWDAQDGSKRTAYEINAETVQILTPRNTPQHQPNNNDSSTGPDGIDDDIPF